MDIQRLTFSRDWNDPVDFPTLEPSEAKVREDLQFLHNETKAYLNNVLAPALEQISLNVTKVIVMTLQKDKWSNKTQSIVAGGIMSDETKQLIQIIPASTSQSEYLRCGIKCVNQSADTLVFSAAVVPSGAITVYAVVTEVSV